MRTLFLCLILAGLAWVIQPAQNLQGSTVVLLGLIVVGSLASVRVAHKLVLPAHLGPLAAGFLLRPTGLLPESLIDTLLPFSDLASVWLGLYLGTTVTSSMLLSRRSLYAALVAVAIPAAITALLFLLFFRTGPIYALQLAFLSAVAAPLLTHLSAPTRRNALAFSLLVTILALLFWSALVPREIPDPESILLGVRNILLWLAVVELSFRTLVRLRTPTGFYVFYGLLALFLYTAATLHGASPLLLAVGTGLFLSVRCGKNRDMLVVLPGLSSLVAPFVVAYFVARLDTSGLHLLTVFHWQLLFAYALLVTLGKFIGSLVSARFTAHPPRDWLQILPQGLIAASLLPASLPASWLPQSVSSLSAAFLVLQGVAIPLMFIPIRAVLERLNMAGSETS